VGLSVTVKGSSDTAGFQSPDAARLSGSDSSPSPTWYWPQLWCWTALELATAGQNKQLEFQCAQSWLLYIKKGLSPPTHLVLCLLLLAAQLIGVCQ